MFLEYEIFICNRFWRSFFIEKSNEKKKALDLLMEKYAGRSSFSYNEKMLKKVFAIDIRIEKISGKKSNIS